MADLQDRLEAAVREHGVVGASLAVLDGDSIEVACAGVADVGTGAPVTPETVFAIWSVTKPMTTMVLLQLVEEGALTLDDAVAAHVPELDGAPDGDGLLVRHLLDCTSGLAGLHFPATGDGPGALAKVIPTLADLPRIHRPGERFAYSNTGFVVAAVIAERLTGLVWDDLLRQRVLQPAGMADTFSLADHLGGRRRASGHDVAEAGIVSHGTTHLRCSGPAGGTVESTAADVCRLGAALCDDRWAPMRDVRASMYWPHSEGWGLGLARFGWGAGVIGWDGLGPGIRTNLRVVPGRRGAIALLTNSGNGRALYFSLERDLLAERWGVEMAPERPRPLDDPDEAASAIDRVRPGQFACGDSRAEVIRDGEALLVRNGSLGPAPVRLLPCGPTTFVTEEPRDYPVVEIDGDFASMVLFGWRRVGEAARG